MREQDSSASVNPNDHDALDAAGYGAEPDRLVAEFQQLEHKALGRIGQVFAV